MHLWKISMYPLLFMGVLCWSLFVMHYFVSFLVLQSSWRGRESWLLCLNCLLSVLWLIILCGYSSWCREFVCSEWLWHFLIILTSYFGICAHQRVNRWASFWVAKGPTLLVRGTTRGVQYVMETAQYISKSYIYTLFNCFHKHVCFLAKQM